jgi:tol-pal system protein YbgF
MKILFLSILLSTGLLTVSPILFADEDAPVVAAVPADDQSTQVSDSGGAQPPVSTPTPTAAVDTSGMSIDQRVAILERQMAAANQINTMNQVNDMQQQLQELQGQLEELSHTVQTLKTQATSQYADVDQRLRKLEGTGGGQASQASGSAASSSSPSSIAVTPAATTTANQNQTITDASIGAERAYQSAYDKVKNGNYSEGIIGMQKFLTQYPTSSYVPNAHYWLGQMHLLKGDGKSAAKEFDLVINQYPQDQKVKDATLKLGFAYLLQNKSSEAKAQFKKVMRLYPGTSTAQLAEARLAQMP